MLIKTLKKTKKTYFREKIRKDVFFIEMLPSIAAGLLLGLHYESIVELMEFCPLPVVCGTNGLGKTKASKMALSLIGNSANFYARVNQRFLPRLCSRSSLPPVIDYVKLPNILEEVVMSSYDNGTDGTCLQETEPRTCPLVTVNYKTLDLFKKDPRYIHCARNWHHVLGITPCARLSTNYNA